MYVLAAGSEGADGEFIKMDSIAEVGAPGGVGFGVHNHEVAGLEVVENRGVGGQGVETCAEVGVIGEEGGYFEVGGKSTVPGGGGLASGWGAGKVGDGAGV